MEPLQQYFITRRFFLPGVLKFLSLVSHCGLFNSPEVEFASLYVVYLIRSYILLEVMCVSRMNGVKKKIELTL
jgi:hypothetical protein